MEKEGIVKGLVDLVKCLLYLLKRLLDKSSKKLLGHDLLFSGDNLYLDLRGCGP